MSRAHVRRTIHDKRESFRLKERERGRIFREGREGADDLTNCSRNESPRLMPCLALPRVSSLPMFLFLSRRRPLYIRTCVYICMHVCMYSRSSNYTCPVIWIGLSNCVQPWPSTNSYLVCKQNRVHSIYVTYPAPCLEFRLYIPVHVRRLGDSLLLIVTSDTVPPRSDFWTRTNLFTDHINSQKLQKWKEWKCHTCCLILVQFSQCRLHFYKLHSRCIYCVKNFWTKRVSINEGICQRMSGVWRTFLFYSYFRKIQALVFFFFFF